MTNLSKDTQGTADADASAGETDKAAQRRARLLAMQRDADPAFDKAEAVAEDALSGETEAPINLGSMLADKKDRLRQLRLLRGFFESPQWVDLTQELVPTSTTREEIEQRKRQIGYQIEVLQALLELMKAEKGLLEKADVPPAAAGPANAGNEMEDPER